MRKTLIKLAALDFGFLFAMPFVVMTFALIPVMGKARAVKTVGRLLTRVGVWLGGWFVPDAASAFEFDGFRRGLKKNISAVGSLWQMAITREEADVIEFRFHYCPVSTVFRGVGLKGLGKYACAADWALAAKNRGRYEFHRDQTIGTGGTYCNPTYSRCRPAATDPCAVGRRDETKVV
jgi:hypothetical protein